jgi:hypothetical protein
VTSSDWALLHTRASLQRDHRDAFDAWQRERHVPEILQAEACVHAAHHRVVEDGLPQIWRGSANVATNYFARSIDDLLELLAGPEVEAAVADGIRWFGKFNELDGAEFTGNIYEPVFASGDEAVAAEPLAVERFEVPERDLSEFDAWLRGHATRLAGLPGVARARTFRAVRHGSPLPYYYSPGNRALVVEAERVESLVDPGALALLAESQAWDRRLAYVRREVLECLFSLPE